MSNKGAATASKLLRLLSDTESTRSKNVQIMAQDIRKLMILQRKTVNGEMAVAAVLAGNYNFEEYTNGEVTKKYGGQRLNGDKNSMSGMMRVTYSKGIHGRSNMETDFILEENSLCKKYVKGFYEATAEEIGLAYPENSGKHVTGKDFLFPSKFAMKFPQLFWSIVYHNSNGGQTRLSFDDMLKSYFPKRMQTDETCWTFLSRGGRNRGESVRKSFDSLIRDSALQGDK